MNAGVSCGPIPGISYSAFAERIGPRFLAERIPLEGSLELTFRCNLRCAHCYVSLASGDFRARQQELTTAEIRRITDEVADLGCLWMLLTGGEPLLRPDCSEIYLHMKRRGFLVALFTNGTLITPRMADLLAEWPPLVVEISIYGSTQSVYEQVTGIPGSYRRCMEGIELLLARQIHLRLKTVPLTLNHDDLGRMRALAQGYGVGFHWDPLVNCRIDGSASPKAVRLHPDEIVALDQQESKRATGFQKEFSEPAPILPSENLFNCNAYLHSFHIDPYGRLFPCMLIRRPAYNLRQGSFRRGWQEVFPRMRKRLRTKALPCDACLYNATCDHCVGWAQTETGDPESLVPFLCDLTRTRAHVFGSRPHPGK